MAARKNYTAAQIINGLRRAEVGLANGKSMKEVIRDTMEDDSIIIVKKPGDRSYTVKLTLNHDGECRYKINGEGEYLRWQVARKVLEPMFF